MSTTSLTNFYENFFGFLAHITSLALTDQEREQVINSLQSFHESLRRVSSRSLEQLESKKLRMKLCSHHGTCVQNCLRGWAKSFVVGYIVKYLVGVAPGLLTGKSLRKPSLLLRELNVDTLQFALFLSTFNLSYKALLCTIRHATGKPKNKLAVFAAGSIAGLSVLIDKNKTRRTTLCLYFLSKSGQFLCRWLIQQWEMRRLRAKQISTQNLMIQLDLERDVNGVIFESKFPSPLSSTNLKDSLEYPILTPTKSDKCIKLLKRHAGTLVMMAASSQILFSFIAMPETLSKSYYSFLVTHSGIRDRMGPMTNHYMNTLKETLWESAEGDFQLPCPVIPTSGQLHISRLHHKFDLAALWAASAWSIKVFQRRMCALIHPETPSCTGFSIRCFGRAMRRSAKLYAPLNAAAMIMFGWKRILARPFHSLIHYVLSTLRSSIFLSAYVTVAWLATCYQFRIYKKEKLPIYMVNGMLSGLCVLIETHSRRLELGMYCVPRALEAFWCCLISAGWIIKPNHNQLLPTRLVNTLLTKRTVGEPVYFALAMGILMMLYETEEDALTSGYRNMMVRLFGVN